MHDALRQEKDELLRRSKQRRKKQPQTHLATLFPGVGAGGMGAGTPSSPTRSPVPEGARSPSLVPRGLDKETETPLWLLKEYIAEHEESLEVALPIEVTVCNAAC